jgi:hypothetical protein|tara:strand:+ start:8527 stop:9138 length:612 start_codon:yes stop_codon:yes gene_type:complete
MKKIDIIKSIKEVLGEKKRPGLWANIRAKRARGEKPAHKNSNAHKDAVKSGKKINSEVSFAADQNVSKGYKYARDTIAHLRENVYKNLNDQELEEFRREMYEHYKDAVAEDTTKEGLWANINAKKKAGKKPSHGNSNAHKDAEAAGNAMKKETANPQDGKAAPHGSGYKSITKEDIHNLVATEIKRPSKQGLKRKLRKALTGK